MGWRGGLPGSSPRLREGRGQSARPAPGRRAGAPSREVHLFVHSPTQSVTGPGSLVSPVLEPGWGWGLTNKSGKTFSPSSRQAPEEIWAPETRHYRPRVLKHIF